MSDRPYVCTGCGVSGVKLWRQYQTFAGHTSLLCAACACKDQKKHDDVDSDGTIAGEHRRTDQIGWMVPAIPSDDGDGSFWGYSAVPDDRCAWWRNLPTRSPPAPEADRLEGWLTENLRDPEFAAQYHLKLEVEAAHGVLSAQGVPERAGARLMSLDERIKALVEMAPPPRRGAMERVWWNGIWLGVLITELANLGVGIVREDAGRAFGALVVSLVAAIGLVTTRRGA